MDRRMPRKLFGFHAPAELSKISSEACSWQGSLKHPEASGIAIIWKFVASG